MKYIETPGKINHGSNADERLSNTDARKYRLEPFYSQPGTGTRETKITNARTRGRGPFGNGTGEQAAQIASGEAADSTGCFSKPRFLHFGAVRTFSDVFATQEFQKHPARVSRLQNEKSMVVRGSRALCRIPPTSSRRGPIFPRSYVPPTCFRNRQASARVFWSGQDRITRGKGGRPFAKTRGINAWRGRAPEN